MKNKSPNEDFILIQKAKNGDKKAFEIVMTKYYPRVHSALYAFTKSYEDAEDLTQQAFIKSWTALESFRGDSYFYTWVYRIAINLAKNFVSSSGYKKSRKSDSLDDTYFEISSQSSLESDILHDDSMQKINLYIKELPEALRTSFILRESEGKSYEEIAEITNTPVGTVRSRIFRARESVLEYLSKEFLDG